MLPGPVVQKVLVVHMATKPAGGWNSETGESVIDLLEDKILILISELENEKECVG